MVSGLSGLSRLDVIQMIAKSADKILDRFGTVLGIH